MGRAREMRRTDVSLSRLSLALLQLHVEPNEVVLARDDHDGSSILAVNHAGERRSKLALNRREKVIAEGNLN